MDNSLIKSKKTNKQKVVWSVKVTIILSLLAYIISQIATLVPIVLVALITGQDFTQEEKINQPWFSLVLLGISSLGLLATLLAYFKIKKISVKSLGLLPLKKNKIWFIPVAYVIYLIFLIITMATITALIPSFNADQAQDVGFANPAGWQLLLAFLGLVVIVPFAEELFFRGFIYQGLRDNYKPMPIVYFGLAISAIFALLENYLPAGIFLVGTILTILFAEKKPIIGASIFTSLLFALAHGQWNVAIDTFILSFALIWVFEKTGSIWASVALHSTKNFIAFTALFIYPLIK